MQSEITVTITGEDATFRKKFLEYDIIVLDHSDERLKSIVEKALSEYKGTPEDITLKIVACWQ